MGIGAEIKICCQISFPSSYFGPVSNNTSTSEIGAREEASPTAPHGRDWRSWRRRAAVAEGSWFDPTVL